MKKWDGWDSFLFFYWKNGPRNGSFMVENGSIGTVLRFFQTTITTFIERLIEQDSILPDD